jgi:hypothetical protein
LVIGAPGYRPQKEIQAAGAVYGYNIKDKTLKFALESIEAQSKFGKSLSYNADRNILAVGAPSRFEGVWYNAGAIYLYNMSSANLTFDNF